METKQYGSLREKIAAEKAERAQRYAAFEALWHRAHAAGMVAAMPVIPTPMAVTDGQTVHVVADGVCGFAWIVVRPATSSFARWAAKNKGARKEYGGGMCLRSVGEFNQSMARKEAYADAFAKVLREAGIEAYSRSRMD